MQSKQEFEEVKEFHQIASKLVKKYPDVFFGLDIDKVKCVAITNKERCKKNKLWRVKPVPMPIRMDCPFSYYVVIFMSDWVELQNKHKYLLVSDSILSIPIEDDKEGTLNAFDMQDFGVMIRTFGPDYLDRDNVPDIIDDDVKWVRTSPKQ